MARQEALEAAFSNTSTTGRASNSISIIYNSPIEIGQ